MEAFPADFKEKVTWKSINVERLRILNSVKNNKTFVLNKNVKALMIELNERFPNTFQMFKELISGPDERGTGGLHSFTHCKWVTVDAEELAADFNIPKGALFRVIDYVE